MIRIVDRVVVGDMVFIIHKVTDHKGQVMRYQRGTQSETCGYTLIDEHKTLADARAAIGKLPKQPMSKEARRFHGALNT